MRHHQGSSAAAMVAMIAVSFFLAGCAGSDTSAPTDLGSIDQPPAAQVVLTRSADTMLVDRSLRLSAILPASHSPGVLPVWSSSDTTVALVSQGGQVFGLKSGTATIRVTVGTSVASTKLTVRPSIRLLRFEADTLALGLSQSVTLPFRAIDSDGNTADLTQHAVEWLSSAPDVAPVSGSGGILGRLLGAADVRLSVDGQASMLRVNVKPQSVSGVRIGPSPISPSVGDQVQLNAVVTDASGTVLADRLVTWSSSNQSVATVNGSGLLVAVATGSAKITAVCENKRSFLNFTVRAAGTTPTVDSTTTTPVPPVASVSVSISSSTMLVGQSVQATAVVTDANSRVLTDRTVSWTTSDGSIASVGATGLVSGVKAGSAVITGAVEGKSASVLVVVSTPVLVPKSITVSAPSRVDVGAVVQATAIVKDVNGTVIKDATINWASNPSSVAAVSANGAVMGRSAGSASLSASTSGLSQSVGVTVVDTTTTSPGTGSGTDTAATPSVSRVAVTLPVTSMAVGATTQATATTYDANGQVLTGKQVAWSTSNATVASVSSSGVVAGLAAGTTAITATIDGKTGSTSITITAVTLSGVPIYPGESIQGKVNAYPAGTTFTILAGTHVRQSVVPKNDDVFLCQPGAILDGENVTPYAIGPTDPWSYRVTVKGCTIQHYAPTSDWMGALGNDGAHDWVIDAVEVRNSTQTGVRLGPGTRLTNSFIHDNAVMGVSAYQAHGALIEGNTIAANAFTSDVSAAAATRAGIKVVTSDNVTVRRNTVRDNSRGQGIWFDIGSRGAVIDSNVVTGNGNAGIWIEISCGAVIRWNRAEGNGTATSAGTWGGAGIQATNSPNVEVFGNTIAGNANGVLGMQATGYPSSAGACASLTLQNLSVHDNAITMSTGRTGVLQNIGSSAPFASWGNRWTANRYALSGLAAPFAWSNGALSWAQWQGVGQDLTGTSTR